MKFGKSLSNQIEETLPEWRDKFLSYKELKKQLKLIVPKSLIDDEINGSDRPMKRRRSDVAVDEGLMTKEEDDFIRLLEDELEKFNSFFVEQEEEYIIKLKELQDRVANTKYSNYDEMLKIRKEIVDFHGEMVLLENYSALNYTGLVKIVKKYDKRTGDLIRLPFIQKVLHQPFFTTDLIYKLVKECERMLDHLFPIEEPSSACVDERCCSTTTRTDTNTNTNTNTNPSSCNGILRCPKELGEIEKMEGLYMKSTISALRALKEICSGSSTVSMFSLPPLKLASVEETWKKIPVLEQVAK